MAHSLIIIIACVNNNKVRVKTQEKTGSLFMKKCLVTCLSLFVMLLSLGIRGAASGSVVVDRVVAVVNDEIITMSDLQREEAKKTGLTDKRLILEDMIDRKLQIAAAKRTGMDVTDKELNDTVADIMKRNSMDSRQFEAALAKEGLTQEQYKAELREQLTLSRVFNKYVRSGIAVDEAEMRAYYERNLKSFSLPEEIRVRHIFLKLQDKATPAQQKTVRDKAQSVYDLAKKGESFAGLVKKYSEAETAAQDGDLGFLQRGNAIPEIEEAARTLKPGEIAGPLQCGGGFHIIRVEDMRTPIKPYDKVKDEIAKIIYEQKMENTYRSWLQTLRSESHIENRL
jgi:peptidyl-prolyl cis-trans isomerase SurA